MLRRLKIKTRAKRAVRFFTTRLALVLSKGIFIGFDLLKLTPQMQRYLVNKIWHHFVTEHF